jgi:glycosyltransferase involved in cell wall biosynthesis
VDSRFRPEEQPEDEEILRSYGIPSNYVLAIGNIHPRKNLSRLLDTYLSLKAARPSMPSMVWAGVQRWESDDLVQRARSAGVILPGFVAEGHLPSLYREAEMLVYPSLYEGLGLPPLEAMACGTPVVASNAAGVPEAIGQAALTVDPTNTDMLADAIAKLLEKASLRYSLGQAGIERAGRFTWERTAKQLLTALEYKNHSEIGVPSRSKLDEATRG